MPYINFFLPDNDDNEVASRDSREEKEAHYTCILTKGASIDDVHLMFFFASSPPLPAELMFSLGHLLSHDVLYCFFLEVLVTNWAAQ